MSISKEELDTMQARYKAAVEAWIAAIRAEEALASRNHDEAELDQWEAACSRQTDSGRIAGDAKKAYEGALRQEFFNF